MHPNVYSSIIYNCQINETSEVYSDWWMDKEDVVYIHKGILLRHKKEWNLAIFNNMDGAREYYPKGNKMELENIILREIRKTITIWFHSSPCDSYMWNLRTK